MTPLVGIAAVGAALALRRSRQGLEEFGVIDESSIQDLAKRMMGEAEDRLADAIDEINNFGNRNRLDCAGREELIHDALTILRASRKRIWGITQIEKLAPSSQIRTDVKTFDKKWWAARKKVTNAESEWRKDCLLGLEQETFVRDKFRRIHESMVKFSKARSCDDKFDSVTFTGELLEVVREYLDELPARQNFRSNSNLQIKRFSDQLDTQIEFFKQTCLGKRQVEEPSPVRVRLTPEEERNVEFLIRLDPSLTPDQIEKLVLKGRRDAQARIDRRREMDIARREEFERKRGLKGFRSRRRRRRFGPATMAP